MAFVPPFRLSCWICFFIAIKVVSVEAIQVPAITTASIATSRYPETLQNAVQEISLTEAKIAEPWIESFNTSLVNATSIEMESDVPFSIERDRTERLRFTTRFLCCLSMISGFGEICSMKSYGCFINMVTGSTVRILVALLEGRYDSERIQLCAITGYILGISLSHILQKYIGNQGNIASSSESKTTWVSLKPVVVMVLSFFSIPELFLLLHRVTGNHRQTRFAALSAMVQAAGYGLIAQTLSDSFGISINVYVLTAQYVAIAKSVVDNLRLSLAKERWSLEINSQQRQAVQLMLSFLFGVVVAVSMYRFCAFLLPFQHTLTGILYAVNFVWFAKCSFETYVNKKRI